jgi:hypothetical protein
MRSVHQKRRFRAVAGGGAILLALLAFPALAATAAPTHAPAQPSGLPGSMRWGVDGYHDYAGVVANSPTDAVVVGMTNQGGDQIKRWDGGAWLHQPNGDTSQSGLSGVDADGPDDVWAVGSFLSKHGHGIQPLALHWDGTVWERIHVPDISPTGEPPSPLTGSNALAAVSVIGPGDVWAVGANHVGEGPDFSLVEHWDGSSWTTIAGPANTPDMYGVLAFSDTDVWAAAGDQGVDHWNGRTWTVYTPEPPAHSVAGGSIQAVAGTGPDDIWAVGGAYPHSLAEHWDGHSWTAAPTPDGSQTATALTAVSAVSPDDVWAVAASWDGYGSFVSSEAFMEHWDGQRWSAVRVPNPGTAYNNMTSLSMDSATDGWAVGRYSGSSYEMGHRIFLHWNGSRWQRYQP